MIIYNWVASPTPKNIVMGRTIKQVKDQMFLLGVTPMKVSFRFETVYVLTIGNKIVSLPGFDDIPFVRRALRLSDGNLFFAVGNNDPYCKFNEHLIKHDGEWTEAGKAWVGALFDI